jgi:pimeloyl-ACP methyl ester carboxylesterase
MNHKTDRRAALKLLTAAPLGLAMSAALAHEAVAQTPRGAFSIESGAGSRKTGPSSSGNELRGVAAQPAHLVTESYHVPAGDPGIELYVRNKRPEAMTAFAPDRILLFVHGATYPAESAFDLELDGLSWMDYIARRGYDVYLMDVRGYGRSTRPPEMDQPPMQNRPIVHTDVAVKDFGTVVDHILARRGVATISLMAWSWGTTIAGAYTAQNSDKVERLVLYAPAWLRQPPLVPIVPLGAYRTVTMEAARQRWLMGVAADKQQGLIPSGWFEAWWQATLETDPVGAAQNPPVVRAPNGVMEDGQRYWGGGDTRYYDPAKIRVPVLLVHAEWDADTPAYMSQALFPRLTAAPLKRYVVIGEGTHSVSMERNRMHLFREVQLFLDEAREGQQS